MEKKTKQRLRLSTGAAIIAAFITGAIAFAYVSQIGIPVNDADDYNSMTLEQLQKKLNAAVEKEDFEKAAELRDVINNRKSKSNA